MNEIRFYKEFGDLGYLATYSNHGFYKENIYWKTSEHYYQAHKFLDLAVRQLIINASTPKEASNIGRNRMYHLRDDWEDIKQDIMFDAVYFKFKQNEHILKKLLKTGDAYIIEETVKENYWGCGPNNDGQNNYGKIVMAVRSRLKAEYEGENLS